MHVICANNKGIDQNVQKLNPLSLTCIRGIDMLGCDHWLTKLLNLCPLIKHIMMYQQGYNSDDIILCLIKDLVENNKVAHVLVVYSKITVVIFYSPFKTHFNSMVGQTLFKDDTTAVIIGADHDAFVECPLF